MQRSIIQLRFDAVGQLGFIYQDSLVSIRAYDAILRCLSFIFISQPACV